MFSKYGTLLDRKPVGRPAGSGNWQAQRAAEWQARRAGNPALGGLVHSNEIALHQPGTATGPNPDQDWNPAQAAPVAPPSVATTAPGKVVGAVPLQANSSARNVGFAPNIMPNQGGNLLSPTQQQGLATPFLNSMQQAPAAQPLMSIQQQLQQQAATKAAAQNALGIMPSNPNAAPASSPLNYAALKGLLTRM